MGLSAISSFKFWLKFSHLLGYPSVEELEPKFEEPVGIEIKSDVKNQVDNVIDLHGNPIDHDVKSQVLNIIEDENYENIQPENSFSPEHDLQSDSTITTTDELIALFEHHLRSIGIDNDPKIISAIAKWSELNASINFIEYEQVQIIKYFDSCKKRTNTQKELSEMVLPVLEYLLKSQIKEEETVNSKEKSIKRKLRILEKESFLGDIAQVDVIQNPDKAKELIIIFPSVHGHKYLCQRFQDQIYESWKRIYQAGISDVFVHEGFSRELTHDSIIPFQYEVLPRDTINSYAQATFMRFENKYPETHNYGLETPDTKAKADIADDEFSFLENLKFENKNFPMEREQYLSEIEKLSLREYDHYIHHFSFTMFLRKFRFFIGAQDSVSSSDHNALYKNFESEMIQWVYTERTKEGEKNTFNVLRSTRRNTACITDGADHISPITEYGKKSPTLQSEITKKHPDAAVVIITVKELQKLFRLEKTLFSQ